MYKLIDSESVAELETQYMRYREEPEQFKKLKQIEQRESRLTVLPCFNEINDTTSQLLLKNSSNASSSITNCHKDINNSKFNQDIVSNKCPRLLPLISNRTDIINLINIQDDQLSTNNNWYGQYCPLTSSERTKVIENNEEQVNRGTIEKLPKTRKKFQSVGYLSLICYLFILALPFTYAQPFKRMAESNGDDKNEELERWVIPCGNLPSAPSGPIPNEINSTNMLYVGRGARNAANFAKEDFQKNILEELRKKSLDPHTTFSSTSFKWLPKLPDFEDKLKHFHSLKQNRTQTLLQFHKRIQTFAVPLDAMSSDYKNITGMDRLKQSVAVLYGLTTNVLCDLEDVLTQNNIPINDNVDKNIMPEDYRNLSENHTKRAERDWIILRELIRLMEYTAEFSEYLCENESTTN